MRLAALALAASLSASACGKSGDPSPTPPRPSAGAPAPTASAGAAAPTTTASAAAPVAPERPADDDELVVSREIAARAGASGLRIAGLRGHGWSRSGPEGPVLCRLSGPPGGPLGFEVRAYSDGAATIEKQFTGAVSHAPMRPGRAEKVRLAGAERDAQSFRTGEGFATTDWCAVRVPSAERAAKGLLVLAHVRGREGAEPTCERSLRHAAIAPLVASFELE